MMHFKPKALIWLLMMLGFVQINRPREQASNTDLKLALIRLQFRIYSQRAHKDLCYADQRVALTFFIQDLTRHA